MAGYWCGKCSKALKTKSGLTNHMRKTHPGVEYRYEDYRRGELDTTSYPCDQCDRVYKTKTGLANHVESAYMSVEKYRCYFCDIGFMTRGLYNIHANTFHLSKYRCDQCDVGFANSKSYKDYMDKVHNPDGWYKFECDQCDYRCRQKYQLRDHVEAEHLGIRHECEFCGVGFRARRNLNQHLKYNHNSDGSLVTYASRDEWLASVAKGQFILQ